MGKRLVTEADVRGMQAGACLVLGGGVVATPAALDLAHRRGVRVRFGDAAAPAAESPLWKSILARDGAYVVVVSQGRASAHRLADGGPVPLGTAGPAEAAPVAGERRPA
jgi:hypothetical protein